MDKELFDKELDKELIEDFCYIAAVSGSSISQIMEAFEQLCAIMSESVEPIVSVFKTIEEMVEDPPDDIATLKKQIKYCKNPMEMKMLNKRLNDAYKKSKGRKNGRKHFA